MLFDDKKAETQKVLVSLILFVAVTFAFIFLFNSSADGYEMAKQRQTCSQAIKTNSMMKLQGNDVFNILFSNGEDPSNVPCPTFYEEIDVETEKVNEYIAEAWRKDWDMMHNGKLELFSGKSGEETYCIVTHNFRFNNDLKNIKGHKVSGLLNYLQDTNIPKKYSTDPDMRYMDYLKCYNSAKFYDPNPTASFQFADYDIDTNEEYGLMFTYGKIGHLNKVWSAGTGAAVGTVAGGVAGLVTVLMLIPEPTMATKVLGIAIGTIAGVTGGGYAGYSMGSDDSAQWEACMTLFPFNKETLSKFNCTYMPGVQGTR